MQRRNKFRTIIPAILFAALPLLSSCSSDSTGPTLTSVQGTWSLRTVNGANLPYVIPLGAGNQIEVISDVITFNADHTFSEVAVLRTTESGTVTTDTEVETGDFTLNGTAVTFSFDSGGTETGSFSGNTLTLAVQGLSLVYRKD